VFILVLANRRDLLGSAANKGWFKVLASVMVGLTATLAVAVVGITVAGGF
jgi:Mn2+/Fe2+ NRAMP family transporter